jgi:hypothetical protein
LPYIPTSFSEKFQKIKNNKKSKLQKPKIISNQKVIKKQKLNIKFNEPEHKNEFFQIFEL